jgi:hypothetical protein
MISTRYSRPSSNQFFPYRSDAVKLPPQSPMPKASAERLVRSIPESSLDGLILFGADSMRTALRQFTSSISKSAIIVIGPADRRPLDARRSTDASLPSTWSQNTTQEQAIEYVAESCRGSLKNRLAFVNLSWALPQIRCRSGAER